MLEISIPGFATLKLEHAIFDYNGTLACDGKLLPGVAGRLSSLAAKLDLHVVTADTFGIAQAQLAGIPCKLRIVDPQRQAEAKLAYLEQLGAAATVCFGNGRNDRPMLEAAVLGIAVMQVEGAAGATLRSADVVAQNIRDALDLLAAPLRLVATLRG